MNKKSFFLYFYLNILFEVLDITNSIRYKLSETAKILKKKKWQDTISIPAWRSTGKPFPTFWLASMLSWQQNKQQYSMWSHLLLTGSVKYKCVYTNTL